jgi:hypothetical protein
MLSLHLLGCLIGSESCQRSMAEGVPFTVDSVSQVIHWAHPSGWRRDLLPRKWNVLSIVVNLRSYLGPVPPDMDVSL